MKHNLVNFTRGSQLLGHFGFMFAAGLKGPLIVTVLVVLGPRLLGRERGARRLPGLPPVDACLCLGLCLHGVRSGQAREPQAGRWQHGRLPHVRGHGLPADARSSRTVPRDGEAGARGLQGLPCSALRRSSGGSPSTSARSPNRSATCAARGLFRCPN